MNCYNITDCNVYSALQSPGAESAKLIWNTLLIGVYYFLTSPCGGRRGG